MRRPDGARGSCESSVGGMGGCRGEHACSGTPKAINTRSGGFDGAPLRQFTRRPPPELPFWASDVWSFAAHDPVLRAVEQLKRRRACEYESLPLATGALTELR
jgi:hypothetical protein